MLLIGASAIVSGCGAGCGGNPAAQDREVAGGSGLEPIDPRGGTPAQQELELVRQHLAASVREGHAKDVQIAELTARLAQLQARLDALAAGRTGAAPADRPDAEHTQAQSDWRAIE